MKKLRKIFSHSFEQRLWSILPVGGQSGLIMELRDESVPQIIIQCYSHAAGLKTVIPEEMPWWSTLVTARQDVFVSRSYGAEGNAGEEELLAFDAHTGKRLWSVNGSLQPGEGEDWIMVKTAEGERCIDIHTGKPAGLPDLTGETENKSVDFPFRYTAGTRHFETVAAFLSKKGLPLLKGVVDYAETADRIIISGFHAQGENLDNVIYVFTMEGEMLFQETIGKNLRGITDNTFFIFSGNLIFVTSRNHFFEYSLA